LSIDYLNSKKKDDAFALAIDTKFKEMQKKLEDMERDQLQLLNRIYQYVDSLRSTVDVTDLIELKQDVKMTLSSLTAFKEQVDEIEDTIEGTVKKKKDLHQIHSTTMGELSNIIADRRGWGFWTYFTIFQVLFWGVFISWKRSFSKPEKKFL